MKKTIKNRNMQLAEAQRTYRQRKKSLGSERLQLWLDQESKQTLMHLVEMTGKTQQESIKYAIYLAYKEQAQTNEVSNEYKN